MSDDHLIEHRVHQEELLRGRFLHAFRDTVRLPNQNLATREYVVHPGAVMVIPMLDTPEGLRLVMERQFRYPVGQVMTEFPAGKLDPGEDPWLCAQRELQEETALDAEQMLYLMELRSGSTQHHVYEASVLDLEQLRPQNEIIECIWHPLDAVQNLPTSDATLRIVQAYQRRL